MGWGTVEGYHLAGTFLKDPEAYWLARREDLRTRNCNESQNQPGNV